MADVLIFDDDPTIGDLAGEVLRDRGLTVGHFSSGAGVIQLIQDERPRLVVLDLMMPGLDGFSACRAIRGNPATKPVKVVVMTAKNSQEDEELARRCGADLFIHKPFDANAFSTAVGIVLKLPLGERGERQRGAQDVAMTLHEGGAALRTPALWVLLDAGAGLDAFLRGAGQAPKTCWLLLSRYERACTEEIDAAARLLESGCRLNLGGPDDPDSTLQHLAPKISRGGPRTPHLYPQREGEFQLAPGVQARAHYTHHPGVTLAYRVDLSGRRIVYCPANELATGEWNGYEMNKFRSFFAQADLLIHGVKGPAWQPVVDMAAECGVGRLLLRLSAAAGDAAAIANAAAERLREKGSATSVRVAAPGETLAL